MSTPVEIAVKAVGTAQAGRAISGLDSKSSKLGRTLSTVAKAGVLALGAGAVYGAKKLIDFTEAAIEDEAAQSKLKTTLQNTTGATDKQVASVEKWISKQGKLLGITDDELRPALQRMAEGTHDVAKAQDMVSLAMDVAAGTGKSLKAVTEALLRAQNGSVGGLSRYGIATKNAKGETLSFDKVVKGMSETFAGQAEKHADTMAGKMERLKVTLSEAGEAIGAKLIPVISDLSGWIVDDAIPALSRMWDNLAPARETIANAVSGVRDVVGAIREGRWGEAWDKAKTATDTALDAIGRGVRHFGKERLIPAVAAAAEGARRSWAKSWAKFGDDPNKSYDDTISSTKRFGARLRDQTVSTGYAVVSGFARAMRGFPGVIAKIAITLNQGLRGLPGLSRHIAVDVAANFAHGIDSMPQVAANIGIRVLGALRSGMSGLYGIAKGLAGQVISGFVAGLVSEPIVSRLHQITALIPDHKGPPAKDRKLLRRSGHLIIKGLVDGFDDGSAGVARVLDRMTANIKKRFDDKAEKAHLKWLAKHDDALLKNARSQDALNKKLDAARSKLKALATASKDYAASIRDSVVATGDVTTLGRGEEGTATIGGILDQMRDRVAAAQRFADLIRKLTKAGLNKTSLRQLLAAGVEGGLTTAEALAEGGKDAIGQVNKLTGELTKAGTGLGDKSAKTMFGAGVKAADALVAGLESRERKLDRTAQRLARKLAKGITGQTRASARDALKDGGPGTPRTVRVRLTADQVSQLQRGREIQADLDAYAASGGRRRP